MGCSYLVGVVGGGWEVVGFGNFWLGLVRFAVERLTMALSGASGAALLSGRGGWGWLGSGWVWKPLVGFGWVLCGGAPGGLRVDGWGRWGR